jgi:hypothetical protein
MEDGRVGTRGLFAAPPVETEHNPALGYAILPLPLMEGRIVQEQMKKTKAVICSHVQVHFYCFLLCFPWASPYIITIPPFLQSGQWIYIVTVHYVEIVHA